MGILTSLIATCAAAGLGLPIDTTYARLTATIGEFAPQTPFLLGEVSGIALDASGHVYVTDFQDPRVVVFASDGRHLATIGRKGQGPGEFTAPTGPVIATDGTLWLRNMEQFVHFALDPATGLATRFDRVVRGPAMAPWRSRLPSIIDRAGRFYFPLEWGGRDGLAHHAYVQYRLDGQRLDSLSVPLYPTARAGWAWYQTSRGGGRMVPGLAVVPFHPLPVWALTPTGTLISGPGNKYELFESGIEGQPLRTITRAVPPTTIPAAERAESLQALKRRVDSLPVPLADLRGASDEVRSLRLPEQYPSYRAITIDPTSAEVWVQRWSSGVLSGKTVLDVFTPSGTYKRTVVLPMNCASEPILAVRGRTAACMQIDPETGAESVMVAHLGR